MLKDTRTASFAHAEETNATVVHQVDSLQSGAEDQAGRRVVGLRIRIWLPAARDEEIGIKDPKALSL